MNDSKNYTVGEFANLAGVTIRTLHYYDEIGLLKPSGRTNGYHRVYAQEDLLRLQQISTLKYLGFSLQEIEELISSPAYNLQRSLQIQKDALNQRIRQLQVVSYALAKTLETVQNAEVIHWEHVIHIIQGLATVQHDEIVHRYYTPEQLDWILERGALTPPEVIEQSAKRWAELYANFGKKRHLPSSHTEVQALAAEMHSLIEAFTGGNQHIKESLNAMYLDGFEMPEAYQFPGVDSDLQSFMQEALTFYRQSHEE